MSRSLTLLLVLSLLELTGCTPGFAPEDFNGTWIEPALPAPELSILTAAEPTDTEKLADKIVVLAFGYTYCPDACPTTMARLARTMNLLGDEAGAVQVALISVDPERDSPERLAAYTSSFHPSFIGLGGSPERIDSVIAPLGIYHARADSSDQPGDGIEYLIDHTTSVLVIVPGSGVRLLWSFETSPEEMAEDLRRLIGH